MNSNDKIKLTDMIMDFITQRTEDKTIHPKHVGSLNKTIGLNGFKVAEIGTPVFETNERYFIMLESLDGKKNLEVTYYKETLKPSIDFI